MKKPLISMFRKKLGLSQRQLAQAVGTSQQQIQRIEAGTQATRLDLAGRICSYLKAPMEAVFPETRDIMKKLQQPVRNGSRPLSDEGEVELEMEQAGVEIDTREWFFKYRLRGGANGSLLIQKKEQRRLWDLVQRTETFSSPFVVFTSRGIRIALNLDHLLFCQFLFEAFPNEREEVEMDEVKVFFADGGEPLSFDPEWEGDSEGSEEGGDLHNLLYFAEMLDSDDVNYVFYFTDSDGETIFLRAKDVAMIQIPESIFHDYDEEAPSEAPNTPLKGTA